MKRSRCLALRAKTLSKNGGILKNKFVALCQNSNNMFKEKSYVNFDKAIDVNKKLIRPSFHRPKLSINPKYYNSPEVINIKPQLFKKHSNVNLFANKRHKSTSRRQDDRHHHDYASALNQSNIEHYKHRHQISLPSNNDSVNETFELPSVSRRSERQRIKISHSSLKKKLPG
jgi:hypothetical protein